MNTNDLVAEIKESEIKKVYPELLDKLESAIMRRDTTIMQLEKELEAAKRLLWAAIFVKGSEIRISDYIMKITEGNREFECLYDQERRETVMRSKIPIPSLTPSAIAPGSS